MIFTTLAAEPVHLVKGDTPPGTSASLPLTVGGTAVLVVVAALMIWRARRTRDDKERAFIALAGRVGLPRSAHGLIRRLALAHGAASPVALLLSEHALRSAVRGLDPSTLPRTERRAFELLRDGLHSSGQSIGG